jgi:hypothetical protein
VASATRGLGTGFVNLERPAIQCGPIELGNHLFHFLAGAEFNESEPAGAACARIPDDSGRSYLKSLTCEKLLKTLVCSIKREISYV